MASISVRTLGKEYRVYPHSWAKLVDWIGGGRYARHTSRWVLRDVTFEVGEGESVGVIGMNGAGKSTLLRILAGTTLPTLGSFEVRGRVAALLELGLGVHPEFTGRQNAILSCQLMGFDRKRIEESLPAIQAFSELSDLMDQPVRTYSAGMQLRLAFSVATAVRPDVLIVDETLSVGDVYFQHKSMARIRAFREQGTTLLFVTHDPAALKALCDRALLLDQGMLVRDGAAAAVFDYYNAMIAQKEEDERVFQRERGPSGAETRSGNRDAELISVEMVDASGAARSVFRVGDGATIRFRIRVNRPMPSPTVGFMIRDRLGSDVFGTNTRYLGLAMRGCRAGEWLTATFETRVDLGPGHYSLSAALHAGRVHLEGSFDWWDRALIFEVVPNESFSFLGVAALPVRANLATDGDDAAPSHRSGLA